MTRLEQKKLEVELMRVTAARMELELKKEEYLDNIEKIEKYIIIQLEKEEELKNKIKE